MREPRSIPKTLGHKQSQCKQRVPRDQASVGGAHRGSQRGSYFCGQQLGDLDGVQRRPLAQVVARDEQREAAPVRHPRVAPDPADQRFVDTASVDDPDGVRYTGVTGIGKPLLADPTPPGSSQLPAGVVQINRRNYLMVATTKNLEPQNSRLVMADPVRGSWQTVAGSRRDGSYQGGRQSQISGYYDPIPTPDSPTGWVYVVANSFTRRDPVVLYRATPQTFTDRSRWQGWASGPRGGWNKPPTPLWPDQVGEMCIRQIDGKAVLSYFNASTGNMEVRVADDPTSLGTAPMTTVVQHDEWPDPAESLPPPYDNRLAQPYGGYISPGSTLDELRIFVSQWNNIDPRARAPYRVIQFAVNPFKPEDLAW